MSLKVHFLHSHIAYFPENLEAYRKNSGSGFTRMSRDIERRTKEDGMSLFLQNTVACLRGKLKKEIGKGFGEVSRKRRKGFIKKMNKYISICLKIMFHWL